MITVTFDTNLFILLLVFVMAISAIGKIGLGVTGATKSNSNNYNWIDIGDAIIVLAILLVCIIF